VEDGAVEAAVGQVGTGQVGLGEISFTGVDAGQVSSSPRGGVDVGEGDGPQPSLGDDLQQLGVDVGDGAIDGESEEVAGPGSAVMTPRGARTWVIGGSGVLGANAPAAGAAAGLVPPSAGIGRPGTVSGSCRLRPVPRARAPTATP